MLSTTTFLLSNTFLLSKFSPPLCSPCFQLHSFYQKHSFYQHFPPLLQPMLSMIHVTRGHLRPYLTSFYPNFSPPLQPMLSTTKFLLSKTFLLSQATLGSRSRKKMFGSIEKYCACHTKRTYRVTQNCSEAKKEPATKRN